MKHLYPLSAITLAITSLSIPIAGHAEAQITDTGIAYFTGSTTSLLYRNNVMLNGTGTMLVSTLINTSNGLLSPVVYQNGTINFLNNTASDITAAGVSQDGSTIIGMSVDSGNMSQQKAVYWKNGTLNYLDASATNETSFAYGVNQDGSVIIGMQQDQQNNTAEAVVWKNGIKTVLNANNQMSAATAVSGDGNVISGMIINNNQTTYTPVVWTNGQMTTLPTLSTTDSAVPGAISNNGKVIVGVNVTDTSTAYPAIKAVSWQDNAITDLSASSAISLQSSYATAVNANGTAIVGSMTDTNGINDGFRWTNKTGMQSIEDWLKDSGVSVVSNTVKSADAINAAGNVVSGILNNGNIYIARGTSGLIDEQSFNQGLAKVANAGQQANNNAALVMNGMHSNPMRDLLADGKSSFSVGGDIGRKNGQPYNSDAGLGEIDYGHRFNNTFQLNLSAGQTYSRTNTDLGGKTTSRSTYIMPEAVITLPHNAYATVDAYYGAGKTHINRGYDNAGNIEMTNASPDTTSFGARLRLDWLNLFSLGKTTFTPYSSLSHMQTRMDGYTENNAAFPTQWNARKDSATIFTAGMDAIYPINDRFTLQGRLEASHQFENHSALTTGDVVGLYSFAFNGQDIKQNWLRAGFGGEAKIGNGTASVMLNATTQGSMPTYWVSANYRWAF